ARVRASRPGRRHPARRVRRTGPAVRTDLVWRAARRCGRARAAARGVWMFRVRGDAGLLIAGALVVVIVSAGGAWVAPQSQPGPRGSTFTSSPEGAKAAYLLLARLGYRVERSLVPFPALALDPREDLLVVTSRPPALSAADRRAIAAFLEAGGIVLATGSALSVIPSEGLSLGFVHRPSGDRDDPRTPHQGDVYRAVLPGPLTRGVGSVTMKPDLRIARPAAPYVTVYEN